MGSLWFESLRVTNLRNIANAELSPSPRLNVISGDNGQGKTSLLEGLYLVATSRSFRAERTREVIQAGRERAVVSVGVQELGLLRQQRAVIDKSERSFFSGDKRATALWTYAVETPIVLFHPGDVSLVSGPALARRTLLRRVALYLSPRSAQERSCFTRAARGRQKVLSTRGVRAAELDALEALMVRHGLAYGQVLGLAAEHLIRALAEALTRLSPPGLLFTAQYRPGMPETEQEYLTALLERREQDAQGRSLGPGPHRAELSLELGGRSARRYASQGQQRILALSLKLAELEVVRTLSEKDPVLLLDDVSSELDQQRTQAVHDYLVGTESQIFITTTRPELLVWGGEGGLLRQDFRVESGNLRNL